MNSSLMRLILTAIVLSAISYFLSSQLGSTEIHIAIYVAVASIVSSLIVNNVSTEQSVEIRTLYVGNLPYRANESMVKDLFSQYGFVQSVRLMKDKNTGKRRGFGFVEISAKDANKAIDALNDTEFQQRTLKVREAKDKPE